MEGEQARSLWELVRPVLDWCVQNLGPDRTVVLVVVVGGFFLLTGFLKNRRADRAWNVALEEKERTIQRLAEEVREHRLLIYTRVLGYSQEQAERMILRNIPEDGPAARKALEEKHEEHDEG